jgi:hypothetical protein
MPTRNNDSQFISWAIGIFTLITFGLASWSLTNNLRGIEEDAVLQQEIRLLQRDIENIKNDVEAERKQDATLRKHWKIHNWTKDEVSELRNKAGLPVNKWPDLE